MGLEVWKDDNGRFNPTRVRLKPDDSTATAYRRGLQPHKGSSETAQYGEAWYIFLTASTPQGFV